MTLYMPEKDIVASYRRADRKALQISILGELNLCTGDEIANVLLRNGVKRSELPAQYRGKNYDLTCKIYHK